MVWFEFKAAITSHKYEMLNVASYVMHGVDRVNQIDIRFISFNVLHIQISSM